MSNITQSARGEACTLRLGKCSGGVDNETVVFAHKNGAGMGLKSKDEQGRDVGFYACFYCHSIYDGLIQHDYYNREYIEELVDHAIIETDRKLVKMGLK